MTEYLVIIMCSYYTELVLQRGALGNYRKPLQFVTPESIEFPLRTLKEKVRWKLLVAVKITQICKEQLYNPDMAWHRKGQ